MKEEKTNSITRTYSRQYQGFEAHDIECEASVLRGLQNLSLSGLPDHILRDSKDKIRALLHNYCHWDPLQRLVVHLCPPELTKCGAHLELPIIIACMVALQPDCEENTVLQANLKKHRLYGSVDLEGHLLVTEDSETLSSEDLNALGAHNYKCIKSLFQDLCNNPNIPSNLKKKNGKTHSPPTKVIVHERYFERFAIFIAAVLREPVLLVGAPGVGKSHLGQWAQHCLPALNNSDRVDVERIWRISGQEYSSEQTPFINPHARSHLSEFIGYKRQQRSYPGYFSLSHKGVLLLDEFPELSRDIREILRNVMDQKEIRRISGNHMSCWPADFWLIGTANPCACGEAEPNNLGRCRCARGELQRYLQRFSGPLLDRFGIQIFMRRKEEVSVEIPTSIKEFLDADPKQLQNSVISYREKLGVLENKGKTRRENKNQNLLAALGLFNIPQPQKEKFYELISRPFLYEGSFR